MATLLRIDSDTPVLVKELGKSHGGIVWTVQPENFQSVVDMINTYGGPECWSIEVL